VITPVDNPDPTVESDWSFGDTEEGVLEAVKAGANILWANTTLHSTCSLVTLKDKLQADLRFVGQDPFDFEKYEDKAWLNDWLNQGELEGWFPRSWLVRNTESEKLKSVELPAVVKPVRGRGSHGVSLVRTDDDLVQRVNELWTESDLVLIEVSCPWGIAQ
jgi:D-alanine-D-alanine ligase